MGPQSHFSLQQWLSTDGHMAVSGDASDGHNWGMLLTLSGWTQGGAAYPMTRRCGGLAPQQTLFPSQMSVLRNSSVEAYLAKCSQR